MLCWSCGKEIPEDATRCRYCEAEVETEPTAEEIGAVEDMLARMGPEAVSELRAAFEASDTGEEFVNRIMVGECLKCGSSKTGDCGEDPEIDDICVGRCFECGQLWCLECGQVLQEDEPTCDQCSSSDSPTDLLQKESPPELSRYHLLAAEIFGYSFANYQDHLGIGNVRYDTLMPKDAETLERADAEKWPLSKLAEAIEVDTETAGEILGSYRRAVQVVDAENPSESFRNAVRFTVQDALEKGLNDEGAIEDLVVQICYRAADLAVLLDVEGKPLSRYSRHLRREPDVEYHDGYFDE